MSCINKAESGCEIKYNKRDALAEIYQEFCFRFGNMEIVTGDGNPDSGIVLIGEAPGKEEVKQKKPFVGSAGKILKEFLDQSGITRDDIFITNAVKYRLSKINEKTTRVVNRPAKKEDLQNCRQYLIRELLVLSPKIIVTLGNVPMNVLTDKAVKIGDVHGKVMEVELEEKIFHLYPMYHPASLIYNRSLYETYLEDLSNLGMLIKELG